MLPYAPAIPTTRVVGQERPYVAHESLTGLVEHLQRIGFTQYEARVYLTLARAGALNGNEISLASEVPSSKTYETLRKLMQKGAVAVFAEEAGTKYVAV